MTELEKLWEQYQTVKETLYAIDHDAAFVAIHTPEGYTNTDEIFDNPNYLKHMRGDLLYYRQDLRRQIIELLQEEDRLEQGYTEDGGNVEPFPIGTPKSDHRRLGADADDGK